MAGREDCSKNVSITFGSDTESKQTLGTSKIYCVGSGIKVIIRRYKKGPNKSENTEGGKFIISGFHMT